MKPGGVASLRGIQAALADALVPEWTTAYAQDAAQTLTMLLESLAADWDTATEDLVSGNAAVRDLLSQAVPVFAARDGNEPAASLVKLCEDAIAVPPVASLRLSALTEESESLRAVLERFVEELEDIAAGLGRRPGHGPATVHLRALEDRSGSRMVLLGCRQLPRKDGRPQI